MRGRRDKFSLMASSTLAIILAFPENHDNIGSVARAIKNMGFSDLRLVSPPSGWKAKSKKMAVSAGDTLSSARVFDRLEEAVRDLSLVVGTTRRPGGHRGAFLPFNAALAKLRKTPPSQKAGLVFGCESKGLANEESALCDHLVTIPTGNTYPSLNLAQAVMVMLFALQWDRKGSSAILSERTLNKRQIETTIGHFEEALKTLGYRKGGADLLPRILKTFRGLIKRSGLLEAEAQMIKGLSRKIREKVRTTEMRMPVS